MLSYGGNDTGNNDRPPGSFSPIIPPSSPPSPPTLDLTKDVGGLGFFYDYEKRVVHGALCQDRNTLLADIRRKHYELQDREHRLRNSCQNPDVTGPFMTMSSDQFNTCCRLNREIGGLLKTLESVESMMLRYDTSFYKVHASSPEIPHDIYDIHGSYASAVGSKSASTYKPIFSKSCPQWSHPYSKEK